MDRMNMFKYKIKATNIKNPKIIKKYIFLYKICRCSARASGAATSGDRSAGILQRLGTTYFRRRGAALRAPRGAFFKGFYGF